MHSLTACRSISVILALMLFGAHAGTQEQRRNSRIPVFRAGADLVVVDVTVRDAQGRPAKNLAQKDFSLYEDGRLQEIQLFSVEDILADMDQRPSPPLAAPRMMAVAAAAPVQPRDDAAHPAATETARQDTAQARPENLNVRNKRWIVLFFDLSSLSTPEALRAQKSAQDFLDRQMTAGDLVAIVQFESTLTIKQDFTQDRAALGKKLDELALDPATAMARADADGAVLPLDPENSPEGSAEESEFAADVAELNLFNSDRKLVAIETIAGWLAPYPEMKALIHFSGGGSKTGTENQVQLRATIAAAARANMAIYPVDARGLVAIPAGGDASRASSGSRSLFDGQAIRQQHSNLADAQETLHTLAADTGGRAFLDSNDLSQVYRQVQQDVQHYYILGYYSSNTRRDGKFRQIRINVNLSGARIKHRRGYYAPKDFTLMTREEKARQLEEAAAAPALSSDLPLALSAAWFRGADGTCYVPVSLRFPAVNIPFLKQKGSNQTEFDFLAQVREEKGGLVSFVKDSVQLKLDNPGLESLANKSLQYDTGFFLKPGRYALKFLVRENREGKIGSFEEALQIPEPKRSGLEVSPLVLGSHLTNPSSPQPAIRVTTDKEFRKLFRKDEKWQDPLVFDRRKLVPSVLRLFRPSDTLYILFDVYGATPCATGQNPSLSVSMTVWSAGQKITESPLLSINRYDDPKSRAVRCRYQMPLHNLRRGSYILQVSVIDQEAGTHAYYRQALAIR